MRAKAAYLPLIAALAVLSSCSAPPPPSSNTILTPASGQVRPDNPTATPEPGSPQSLISQESLLSFIDDLTSIQPYSGWRSSATEGEAEAFDYVTETLSQLDYLVSLGLELERQELRVFMTTELWETRVHLTVGGEEIEVSAAGIRGPRDEPSKALRFDSDGVLNDTRQDPVVVEGPVVLIRSAEEIDDLSQTDLQGSIVVLDYGAIDRAMLGSATATGVAARLLEKAPLGILLITQYTNQRDHGHGTFVGDINALGMVENAPTIPALYARLEDLGPAGISSWEDLETVESVRLTWDADVLSPADSGNLVARIPGADASQAVILGAHIDSPNSPGAMDDGSGSAVLLEIARVLNDAQFQPPTDLYLVWFGSEELGLYGSYHFVSTHQELLDRTLAMLQIDMLAHPPDGVEAYMNLVTWSHGRLGDETLTWPEYLIETGGGYGLWAYPSNFYGVESDNTGFSGFDVPNANLIYMDFPQMAPFGGIHHASNVHSPYDTLALTSLEANALEQMTHMAIVAGLNTGQDTPSLRLSPSPQQRAVFVGSHTESVHMSPATQTDLGMALSWEGLDVDMVPYGQPVSSDDLEDAALVIVLPVVDYPSPETDTSLYDESWQADEIAALEEYVNGGGLLVLTNSANRLKYNNRVLDANEDWSDASALGEPFGVQFQPGTIATDRVGTEGSHPLIAGINSIALLADNGVRFTISTGEVLAQVSGEPVVALTGYGSAGGEVLILADLGILGASGEPENLPFWLNLARYALSR